jgi:hypothetical protein
MFNCLKKIQHFFRTPRGKIVVKLGMQYYFIWSHQACLLENI